jgi:integrase
MNEQLHPIPAAANSQSNAPRAQAEAMAMLQQLLGSMAGVPVATTVAKPFQFPSLEHLNERMAAVLVRAKEVEGLSAKTVTGYRSAFSVFRLYLTETKSVTTFLAGQVQEQTRVMEGWIAWLRSRGANHTSVNTYWRQLHAPFARIARQDGCVDPTTFLAPPKPGRPFPRFLTRKSLDIVFRFVRNYQWPGSSFERTRNIALLAVMAFGGCRKGEVLRLCVEDVNCEATTIRIVRGKGQNGGKGRVICMPPALNRAMVEYLAERERRELATDRLFVRVKRDEPIGDITLRRLCAFIGLKTGIHVAPHMLRHTCATLMRQQGVPDRLTMEQLGHTTLGVLQRYSHVEPGERQQVISRLALDFGGDAGEVDGLNDQSTRAINADASIV